MTDALQITPDKELKFRCEPPRRSPPSPQRAWLFGSFLLTPPFVRSTASLPLPPCPSVRFSPDRGWNARTTPLATSARGCNAAAGESIPAPWFRRSVAQAPHFSGRFQFCFYPRLFYSTSLGKKLGRTPKGSEAPFGALRGRLERSVRRRSSRSIHGDVISSPPAALHPLVDDATGDIHSRSCYSIPGLGEAAQ